MLENVNGNLARLLTGPVATQIRDDLCVIAVVTLELRIGREEPKKTSIHLVNRTAFAGVTTRKSAIILTIKSDRRLSSPRTRKSEQTSASRFHHEVKLTSPTEVDSELVKWLQDAYALSE